MVEQAAATFLAAIGQSFTIVSDYYRRLAEQTRQHGTRNSAVNAEGRVPADRGLPGHSGPPGFPGLGVHDQPAGESPR
ncbi:hypothetical protein ABIB25_000069 [Nakamurella sp. UYEF19]